MGEIFFDYPSNSAIDEGDVISPQRTILNGIEITRIGFMKGSVARFSRKLELLMMIPEIKPPSAMPILEAGDVFQLIVRRRSHSVLQLGCDGLRSLRFSSAHRRRQALNDPMS